MSALSPYWDGFNQHRDDSLAQIDKDGFSVRIAVHKFKPEEISVKTVDDMIYINAKHEEKQGEGHYIKREVSRQFNLPRGFKPEDVVSSLSTDGFLSVRCARPLPAIENANTGYQVPIHQSGQPNQWL
ncbi:heat shock protein 26-like [Contarinia nasturtii]|uniref:heat shock protein 26-like n=1 Tax=Contarinia nasturtii TaxID=265458 RepID=UPI0012D45BC8|nr:heat shock protein 26-like [Contarinia nasturtii]